MSRLDQQVADFRAEAAAAAWTQRQQIADFRAEAAAAAWTQRSFLKELRRGQARSEALSTSVFTLTPAGRKSYRPGINRLELRLYCEQPGAFHAMPDPPYIINEPASWLTTISPYLIILVKLLKHTAPLAGPVLGLTAEHLANQLKDEVKLMTEMISQLPSTAPDGGASLIQTEDPQGHIKVDTDYRAIRALLREVDPGDHWAGLNRTLTPEDQIIWLCSYHAQQYTI